MPPDGRNQQQGLAGQGAIGVSRTNRQRLNRQAGIEESSRRRLDRPVGGSIELGRSLVAGEQAAGGIQLRQVEP